MATSVSRGARAELQHRDHFEAVRCCSMRELRLEPEQDDLLLQLVDARRGSPEHRGEPFTVIDTNEVTFLDHPGLPDRRLIIQETDLAILESRGLILATKRRADGGIKNFTLTPDGNAYCDAITLGPQTG